MIYEEGLTDIRGYQYFVVEYETPLEGSSSISYSHVIVKQLYDQNPASFDIFRWFRSMVQEYPSEVAAGKVTTMTQVFSQCKSDLPVPLREYILLEGIARVCFLGQVQDSGIVLQVFQCMFDCWRTFGPLHFKGIIRPPKKRKPEGTPQERSGMERNYLSFFFRHACVARLVIGGNRMIDVSIYPAVMKAPLTVATDVLSGRALLRYLQYGARFEDVVVDPMRTRFCVSSLLTDVLRTFIRKLWFRAVSIAIHKRISQESSSEFCETIPNDVKRLCLCFRIILRAIKQITPGSLDFIIQQHRLGDGQLLIESNEVISHIVISVLVPTLHKRYVVLPELKHLCRWTIRQRLNQNWELPEGIYALPLPIRLKRYLNLLAD